MKTKEIAGTLLSFAPDKEFLKDCVALVDASCGQTFETCLRECLNPFDTRDRRLEIDSILDYLHDELNTGHWSDVPIRFRHAFTATSFLKTLNLLRNSPECTVVLLRDCLKALDMGLLLGAPLPNNPDLLAQCANYISQEINKGQTEIGETSPLATGKRKCRSEFLQKFELLKGEEVSSLSCPSLETFSKAHYRPQIPVKLKDCMSHWPASTKWLDVNYLLNVVGDRTFPIEIGSHYADEDWRQKLMVFKDFIKEHFLQESGKTGYLAQHNLFDQVPELKEDIYVPDYCCLSNDDDSEPEINAWLGPEGTVSPLHQDPKNNFLAQVFGTKQLILFSPSDTPYLHPYEGKLLSNTSQINPLQPDLEKYPDFSKAVIHKCLLEPGEMLYIPVKWWHHVTALDKSFSVSFWWQ